jgi:hypothetical protein
MPADDVAMAERLIEICRAERHAAIGREIAAGNMVG